MLPTNSKGKNFEIFEFLLDFNLVDVYLDSENRDDLACQLIVNFLYAASLSEQKSKQRVQAEETRCSQCDRSVAFGLLAMKAASAIQWDLCTMEERIPAVAIGDLLNIFVTHCIGNDKNFFSVDLDNTPDHLTFGIQLFCRWHVRAVIQANFVNKPDKGLLASNLSDPMKHIHHANKQALQNLSGRVADAVQALERCYLVLRDLVRPTSACFAGPINDFRGFHVDWQKGERYPKTDLLAHVAYDLGLHYFIHKRFAEASAFLHNSVELSKRCKSQSAKRYFHNAEALAYTSSALSSFSFGQVSLKQKLNNISQQDLFIFLNDDNETKSLKTEERLSMELTYEMSPDLKSIIEACNVVYSWIYDDVPLKVPKFSKCPFFRKALQRALAHFPKNERLRTLSGLYAADSQKVDAFSRLEEIAVDKEFSSGKEVELPCTVRLRKVLATVNTKQLLLLMGQMTSTELSLTKDMFIRQVPNLPTFVCDWLSNGDQHIMTYIVGIFMKAYQSKHNKDFHRTHTLLSCILPFLEDFSRVRKYVQCEILYCEIQICKQNVSSGNVDEDLIRRVTGFLNNLPRENDAPDYLICSSLAFLISLQQWNFIASLRKLNYSTPCLEAATLIAKICLYIDTNDVQVQKEIDKLCSLLIEEPFSHELSLRKSELLKLVYDFHDTSTMNVIIRVLSKASRTGISFLASNEIVEMWTSYESPELISILASFLRYSIIALEFSNYSRVFLYAETLSKFSEITLISRGYFELILSIASVSNRSTTICPEIYGYLYNLACSCKRYFEAAFWAQYTETSDRYCSIFTEILKHGSADVPERVIPFIYDVALLEFLAAAMAEKGSFTLWDLSVKRMSCLESCLITSGIEVVQFNEDKKRANLFHGVLEIIKLNYQLSHLFEFNSHFF